MDRYIPSHRRLFQGEEPVSAKRSSCAGIWRYQIMRRLTKDIRHHSVSERCCTYHKPFWFSFWGVRARVAGRRRRPAGKGPSPQPPSSPPNRRGPLPTTLWISTETLPRHRRNHASKATIRDLEKLGLTYIGDWFVMEKNLPSGI